MLPIRDAFGSDCVCELVDVDAPPVPYLPSSTSEIDGT